MPSAVKTAKVSELVEDDEQLYKASVFVREKLEQIERGAMPAMSEREMRLAVARGRRAQRRQALRDSTVDAIVAPTKYTSLIAAGIINWSSEAVPVRNLLMNGSSSSNGNSSSFSSTLVDSHHQIAHSSSSSSSSTHHQPSMQQQQAVLQQDIEYILSLEGAMAIESDLLDAKIVILDAESIEKNPSMKRLIKTAQADAELHNKAIAEASSSSSSSSSSAPVTATTTSTSLSSSNPNVSNKSRVLSQAMTASSPPPPPPSQSGHKRKALPPTETTILPGRSPLRLRMGGLGVPAFSVIEVSPYDTSRTKTWRDRYNKGDPKVGTSVSSLSLLRTTNTFTTTTTNEDGEGLGGESEAQLNTTALRSKRLSTKKNFDVYSSSSSSSSSSAVIKRGAGSDTPSWWKEQQSKPWILWPPNGPKRSPPPPLPPPPSIGNLSSESSSSSSSSGGPSSSKQHHDRSSFALTHPYYNTETNDNDDDGMEGGAGVYSPPDAPRIGWDYSFYGEQLELVPLMRFVNEHSYVNGPCLRKAWDGAVAQAALYPHLHQGIGVNNGGGVGGGGKKKKKKGEVSTSVNKATTAATTTTTTTSSRVVTKPSTLVPKLKLTATRRPALKPTGPSYTADDFVWGLAKQTSSRSRSTPLVDEGISANTGIKSTTDKGKTSSLMSLGLGGNKETTTTTTTRGSSGITMSQQHNQHGLLPHHPLPRSLRLRGEDVEPPPDPSKLPVELRPTVWATSSRKRDRGGGGDTTAPLPSKAGVAPVAATRTKRIGSEEPLPPPRQSLADTSFSYPPPPPYQQQIVPPPPSSSYPSAAAAADVVDRDDTQQQHQRRSPTSLFNPVSIWNTSPRIAPSSSSSSSSSSAMIARKRSRPSDQAPELQKSRKSSLRGRVEEEDNDDDEEEDEEKGGRDEISDNTAWTVGSVLKNLLSGGLR